MDPISLAVRDFALPVPRTGSIELHSGYGAATADGQEIHLRLQLSRKAADPAYQSEVAMTADFERDGYLFRIGGRVDGFYEGPPARIEEIKSAFNLRDLQRKLRGEADDHPYRRQLRTYGYFYWLKHKEEPKLSFYLVSTRSGDTELLEIALDVDEYERWLESRLGELVAEAKRAEKLAARRKKIARVFAFPFESPRPGQKELIATVEKGMEDKRRMLIQAPTGLGKTAGVLYPMLKEALGRGQRVIYVTPKNSQHAVAEDAVERFQEQGAKLKSLTITAKSKICFKAEPLCNPDYCEYARDHYRKVDEFGLVEQLAKKRKLTARTFQDMGEEAQVCPFELQLEAAKYAEVVICDYNYVFAPRASSGRLDAPLLGQNGKPNLVVDEAHNLFARAMDYYSPALSTIALERMRESLKELPTTFRADGLSLLGECIDTVAACRPDGAEKSTLIDPPAEAFLEQEGKLRSFLSRYLDSDVEIRPKDVVLRMCFYWSEFTAALELVEGAGRPEFFTTFQPHPGGGGMVKITCCDAAEFLRESYDRYEQVAGFSATLKPFDYYAKLSGLNSNRLETAEFSSPFPKRHRKLLVIPEISTKYSQRERNYGKIAEAIRRIAEVRKGNYFAFFPSFDFLSRTMEKFQPPPGFVVLRQEREMNARSVEGVLRHLRDRVAPTVVFAVQGGVFSEGVDYPGETIIGAFVVGPPLPVFDLERERMREYYQEHYGAGFDYAYSFPAMAKAIQAAGRVIRSETDRGLIVLMDGRFIAPAYSQSMPSDWFEAQPRELVSSSILKDVAAFWNTDS